MITALSRGSFYNGGCMFLHTITTHFTLFQAFKRCVRQLKLIFIFLKSATFNAPALIHLSPPLCVAVPRGYHKGPHCRWCLSQMWWDGDEGGSLWGEPPWGRAAEIGLPPGWEILPSRGALTGCEPSSQELLSSPAIEYAQASVPDSN